MNYDAVPFVKLAEDTWNVDDETLMLLWAHMVREGKASKTFYDGTVTTADEWVKYLKLPHNLPVMVVDMDRGRIVMVAWLNKVQHGTAQCHFVCIGPYKRGMGDTIMRYWSSFRLDDGAPMIKTLVGITPEVYGAAIKLTRLMGFSPVGVIPYICNLVYENRQVGGAVAYYCPKGG